MCRKTRLVLPQVIDLPITARVWIALLRSEACLSLVENGGHIPEHGCVPRWRQKLEQLLRVEEVVFVQMMGHLRMHIAALRARMAPRHDKVTRVLAFLTAQ